ncbi:putative NUDIX family phosphoesterase [Virgibacillus halotolerans]|uniref:hypothetical protein n=1 Tax=Virgibacillus halotolerans TaxID=1071053 RepID=UPI001961928F|nr:hypothetical protein [Virgibacillus halotolerans]MBM7598286.1 putative NUDIX family phosphoesterase [Virgibacillus halotolerans]
MNKMDEMIIVVPRKNLFEDESLAFQGVNSSKELLSKVVDKIDGNFSIMRRGNAEENESFKQPIPYAVLRKGDDVFIYERLQGGGEARLHNQLSLGVGGHMNGTTDYEFNDLLYENLNRELDEELFITDQHFDINIIGLINDDVNEVGKVHIGLLAIIELTEEVHVEVREIDQIKGGWIPIKQLKDSKTYDNLESWSQFVVDILNK